MTLAAPNLAPGRTTVAGAPEGFDALVIAKIARKRGGIHLHIARDDARASQFAETLLFFDPKLPVLQFPAWDCLPYDRVSPKPEIAGERMAALAALAARDGSREPLVVITTVNAALQRGVHRRDDDKRFARAVACRKRRQRGHSLTGDFGLGRHPVVGQTIPGRELKYG